jgi:hypothetical protein
MTLLYPVTAAEGLGAGTHLVLASATCS